jgi:hypothetical protein
MRLSTVKMAIANRIIPGISLFRVLLEVEESFSILSPIRC